MRVLTGERTDREAEMDLFLFGAGLLYLFLQLASLMLLRGRWRRVAWACAGIMAVAITVGLLGGYGGSDMAPLWIVIAMPILAVVLAVLLVVRGIIRLTE
ncbi:MAG TPA: hypothetical protein VJM81_01350 [Rhizorhapis sp.]|nr:hypothetical protein [Rhizorhapis sp.]